MKWVKDTGGREKYYRKLTVGDCVVRAIAIANNMDYKVTYNIIKNYNNGFSPRDGVNRKYYEAALKDMGWEYIPCCGRGHVGEYVRFNEKELPTDEIIICKIDGHIAAVINGVLHDTYDCSRQGTRHVYGYWKKRS